MIQIRKTEFCLGPLWFWVFALGVSAHSSRLHRGWPRAYPRSLASRALYGQIKEAFVSRGRDISCLIPPAQNPHERSLAHAALISDDWRRSVARDKDGARVEKEATAWQWRSCVPTSPHAFDCDGTERATTC